MKKILIVDDEQDIVESLKFVLEVSGYVCYTAYNGEDGLRLAKEIMPDLIILDVMMPKINGYKITRQQKTGMVENRRREQKMCRIQVQKTVPQVIGWKALRENISAILN